MTIRTIKAFAGLLALARSRHANAETLAEVADLAGAAAELKGAALLASQVAEGSRRFAEALDAEARGVRQ